MPSRGLTLALLSLLVGASGCDLPQNLGDLGGSLLDPDAEVLETPGRQLASGHYSRLELDGSLESGGWVVAKRHDLEEEAVSVISFVGEGQCEVPGATDFQRVSSRIDVALPGLIAFQKTSGTERVRSVEFANFACEPRLQPVERSGLPSMPFPSSSPRGLLMLAEDGRLLLVDAKNQVLEEVATDVRSGSSDGDRLWLFQGAAAERELVVYDSDLRPQSTWPGVTELLVLRGWYAHDAVIRDSEGLHLIDTTTGTRELLAPEGCGVTYLGSQVLAYFAPCEERYLRLSVPGQLLGRLEDRVTIGIASQALNLSEIIPYWQGENSFVLYQVNPTSGSELTGELRVAENLGVPPEERTAADRVLAPSSRVSNGQIYLDWDGTSGTAAVPRLKSRDGISAIEALDEVASRVAQLPGGTLLSERGALINFDGQVGELVRFTRNGTGDPNGRYSTIPLAERVPIQVQAVDPTTGAFAFVGEMGERGGTAYLVTSGAPRPIGQNALPGTLRFLEQPHAVAYLAHDGTGQTATLRAWLLEAGLDVRVSDLVSEFRELPWPSPGLLYAIPTGDRAGIWFARAR
jgi:hypothetical protein